MISGSVMPLNEMCKNLMTWCDSSIFDIVQMASINANDYLGNQRKGRLQVGNDADIVIFDSELKPLQVFVEGSREL